MRYTLMVRSDSKDLVEAVISKLPSHYIKAWVAEIPAPPQPWWAKPLPPTIVHYSEPTEGAVEVQVPVGQLATLTAIAHEEGVKPAWYVCSGEFTSEQVSAIKAAMKATKLAKDVTWKEVEQE